jgi:Uma2 family endonuclease
VVANARLATIQDIVDGGDARLELLRGELIEMSPVSFRHSSIVVALLIELGAFVKQRDLGLVGTEGGFVLERDPDTLLAPDIAFIRKDRLPPDEDWDTFPELVPDLVIEVVSPHDRANDVYDKTRTYLEVGVRMALTVWPKRRTVTVERPDAPPITLTIDDVFDAGDVLPGFSLPIARIFE